MEPRVITEAQAGDNAYLQFTRDADRFFSESDATPRLSYFRVELARIRPGMSDFLMRVSTPKYEEAQKSIVVTLRGTKDMAKYDGALGASRVLIREMGKRGDKTHDWSTADEDHLAQMLAIPLKTFSLNPNIDLMRFSTEAIR